MKDNLLKDLIRVNDDLIIPSYLVKNYSKFGLNGEEFLLLVYFINQKNNPSFDIKRIGSELNLDSSKILELINSLNEKNYISIEMKKENGVIEEFISTDLFYNKAASIIMDNKTEETNNDIYSVFEKEFGRVLGSSETEIINRWLDNNVPEELIKEALKEAVLSGVRNMKYIDSIIFRWVKEGYKKREDIKRKRDYGSDLDEIIEVDDWLNE
ncbi:MAG: DnaD domain protein [Bacilli bacterium]|nr:DnaD domain protein [Bacilli bacterium]